MHGIVHKTLEAYVVDRTDEETWDQLLERAGVEAALFLPVSYYDDADLEAILEAVTDAAVQDRRQIERGFGRRLAPELLSTFGAHVSDDWDLLALLASLESVAESVDASSTEATLPDVSGRRDGQATVVSYRSRRDTQYCGLAHGILEGLVDAADESATVSKHDCVETGDEACTFRVALE
ncbi:heme NO-binding domain-containing protein [Natrarchaeobaculum aegyptiacum]|uniref:Heme NO-binding domain-containing protein n=1 Tax=Natrarchaeobaculum aegyptiacum TaxID=745377 RepID=A0A2Z2HWJ5_9EURY|nr:heme NO-binding domain-containing protein [Natrarchaeobaculum aegyptiacum]ARS89314.1 hypothetical protein B1756_05845 [Natrarchaeobaculum aegyptiacum]